MQIATFCLNYIPSLSANASEIVIFKKEDRNSKPSDFSVLYVIKTEVKYGKACAHEPPESMPIT